MLCAMSGVCMDSRVQREATTSTGLSIWVNMNGLMTRRSCLITTAIATCAPVYVNVAQDRIISEQGTSFGETPPPADWPVGKPVVCFLD